MVRSKDNVTRLHPGHAWTEQEALGQIRHVGGIEVDSITALGKIWKWEQSRTSKAVIRWVKAGHIVREAGAGGHVIIRVPGLERRESGQEHGQEGAQEQPEAREHGQEHSFVSAQEFCVPDGVPGVPAGVPSPALVGSRPTIVPAGVPEPILERLIEGYAVLVWCRWALAALCAILSTALYIASLFLNATFWSGLAPAAEGKAILVAGGIIIETINCALPRSLSI